MHAVASRGNAGNTSSEEEKRLTYVFNEDEKKHSAAINCLTVLESSSPDGCHYLFTGSRDGTSKRYALAEGCATYSTTFYSHLDWVTALVLTGGTLVSGSSDTTIKVWDCLSDGTCIRTLKKHSDYVTCLAAAKKKNNIVASGGLAGEVFIWDIEAAVAPVSKSNDTAEDDSSNFVNGSESSLPVNTGQSSSSSNTISSHTTQSQGYVPLAVKGHKDSVNAMAMNETGTVLVSGGTEKVLRVWDPRTGSKTMKLKGHTDNVRALLLDSTGRYCLSGSSDSMIRLWDLGQQRCVHSYAVHADSVWALASTPTFSHVYSGGRDLSLYLTDLATRETALLCTNEYPILQLALHDDDIWVATTDSSLKKWPSERHNPEKVFQRGASFLAGNLASSRARVSLEGTEPVPVYGEPSYCIPGNPRIVQHEILNNRIHVLTKDIAGTVKLWQITNGSVIENYGKVSFEEKKEELSENVTVPAWFTMDNHRFGSLSVHLDTPGCFRAEMYSTDLSIDGKPADHKVNLAKETLKGLFFNYLTKRKHRIEMQKLDEESTEEESIEERSTEDLSMEKQSIESQASENGILLSAKDRSNKAIPLSKVELDGNAGNCAVYPPFKFSEASSLSIIAKGSEGGVWKMNPKDLDGTEDEKVLPDWVLDCVLYNRLPARANTNCSFFLHPYDGSTVQILTQPKLAGPCILRIHKVANHVLGKMVGKPLDSMTSGESFTPGLPGGQLHPPAAAADGSIQSGLQPWQNPTPSIEILCDNQVLPPEMSLSTVRAHIWKKPEDLVLHYRVVPAR